MTSPELAAAEARGDWAEVARIRTAALVRSVAQTRANMRKVYLPGIRAAMTYTSGLEKLTDAQRDALAETALNVCIDMAMMGRSGRTAAEVVLALIDQEIAKT